MTILFDNDAEGGMNWCKCQGFNVPGNMRIIKLPDLDAFTHVKTAGPNGSHPADINGGGAAIECYLDLGPEPVVRWSSFNEALSRYQGALINKDKYKHAFLAQDLKQPGYDYSKLQAILDLVVLHCVGMREGGHGRSSGI